MLVVSSVGAVSEPFPEAIATQSVSGTVPAFTVTITAPGTVSGWELQRGQTNERDVGPVYISTTAPSAFKMNLAISGNFDEWTFGSPLYVSTETPPVDESSWVQLTTGSLQFESLGADTTPTAIPVRLRQYVSVDDPDGLYSVGLIYTVSVTPPSP